jgi:phosphate transport system protein
VFHQQLSGADDTVRELFTTVTVGLGGATAALLNGDTTEADRIAKGDRIVDDILAQVERQLQRTLVLQAPVAGDLRFILTVLRIVPELERSADLVAHIAKRADIGLALPASVRARIEEMGQRCTSMWEAASSAWIERDANVADRLDVQDDELDVTVYELMTSVAGTGLSNRVAMEAALLGRFNERLGDHAVHTSRRIGWLATGN